MIGTSMDRYKILEELGQGGMSVVYRGLDTVLEREVAVKVLRGHLASKPESRKRFHREAKAIAMLRHPNILEVFDYSSEDADNAFIIMEYIPGLNLRQFLSLHGPPPAEVAAAIALIICGALEHAHQIGVIHRDLKPENIMISNTGNVHLMDFGIAHVIGSETMTQTGSLLGSPAHMAPEIIEGLKADQRSDIFSLGTMLYWIATGKLPFDGQNAPQVLKRVLDGNYTKPDIIDPRIGCELAAIINRCMATAPENRFQNTAAIREALTNLLAANGFKEPIQLFHDYFADPNTFTQNFPAIIIPRLTLRGQKALRDHLIAQASQTLSRVLTYDPNNAEVLTSLNSISKQNSLRRASIAVLATLIIAAGIGLYIFSRMPSPDDIALAARAANVSTIAMTTAALLNAESIIEISHNAAQNAALSAATLQSAQQNAAHLAQSVITQAQNRPTAYRPLLLQTNVIPKVIRPQPQVGTSKNISITEKLVDMQPIATARPTSHYRFNVSPAAATLYIEGRAISSIEAAQGISLSHGRHVITARSQGCKPFRQEILVDSDQTERIPIVLNWEDGFVHLQTNQNALVWLNDDTQPLPVRAGAQGTAIRIPFGPADKVPSEQKVSLRIAPRHDLQQSRSQLVTVRPGAHANVNINFTTDN